MDLNLLVVLDVLLDEANVTRASKRLGMSQSATSHALARLRSTFDDPLLVRSGSEMRPTPRAETLRKDLRHLLSSVRRFMDETDSFDPGQSEKVFSLGILDNMLGLLGPIASLIEEKAPKAELNIKTADYNRISDVSSKEVSIVIAPMSLDIRGSYSHVRLGELSWGVLMRKGHPAFTDWGVEQWTRFPHLRVATNRNAPDLVKQTAEKLGLTQKFGATVSSFGMAAPILTATNMIFTTFREPCLSQLQEHNLQLLEAPIPLKPISFGLFWSPHLDKDPACKWFQDLIVGVFREVMQ